MITSKSSWKAPISGSVTILNLTTERRSCCITAYFFTDHRVDDRSEYYQLPFNHPADIAAPPAWAQDAVVYNIFPDSFATGRRFISGKSSEKEWNGQITRGKLGGTLRGVIEIWITFKNWCYLHLHESDFLQQGSTTSTICWIIITSIPVSARMKISDSWSTTAMHGECV